MLYLFRGLYSPSPSIRSNAPHLVAAEETWYFPVRIEPVQYHIRKEDALNYRSSINKCIGIQSTPFYKNKTISTEPLRYPRTIGDMARKRGSKDVDTERKRAIVDMVNEGLTPKQVAMYYDMSPSTVRSMPHQYRRKGTVNGVHSRGRIQKLDQRSIRLLLSYVRKNRFEPLYVIANMFKENKSIYISVATMRRYMHASNIRNYSVVSKTFYRNVIY